VEGLSGRYLRRSLPLLGLLAGIGLELGDRAGSRLAGLLGIAVHPVTLLRLVAARRGPVVTAAPQERGRTHRHGRAPTVQRRSSRSARITGDAILLPPPR
jgi:hypothetical protein